LSIRISPKKSSDLKARKTVLKKARKHMPKYEFPRGKNARSEFVIRGKAKLKKEALKEVFCFWFRDEENVNAKVISELLRLFNAGGNKLLRGGRNVYFFSVIIL
jgi:hypothetical protein